MKFGSHNTLTAWPLLGWQKIFGFIINTTSRCQISKNLLNTDCIQYDIQINYKNGRWIGSHGIAWYDIDIEFVLSILNNRANQNNETIYIRLGYDNHFGINRDVESFDKEVEYLIKTYTNLTFYELWYEKENITKNIGDIQPSVFEGEWTLTWAKNEVSKYWWKFPLVLPLPRLWNKLFNKYYKQDFISSNKEIWMGDFI